MKKSLYLIVLSAIFLLFVALASAIQLPADGQTDWDDNPTYGIENWLLVAHAENGTLKKGLNISFDEGNFSRNLIVLGNIFGEIPNSFKNSNFTNLYDLRDDRFLNVNFTAQYDNRADRFGLSNFTSAYNSRADRFGVINFTSNYEGQAYWKLVNFTSSYDSRADRFLNLNFTTLLNTFIPSFFNNGNFTIRYDVRVDRFSNENFTSRYDLRTDRYGKENFTAQIDLDGFFKLQNYSAEYSLTGYKLVNFTNSYDLRADRFGNTNFTILYDNQAYWKITNQTAREGAYFKIENGTSLPFSNYRTANTTDYLNTNRVDTIAVITENATVEPCVLGEIRGNVSASKICLCTTTNNWKCATVS